MRESKFATVLNKWFETMKGIIIELINGKRESDGYQHETKLTREYSLDGSYETMLTNQVSKAAKVVAYDSDLPYQDRGELSKVSGDVVKTGVKMQLREKLRKKINVLIKLGKVGQAIKSLFADDAACVIAIKERIEYQYLEGLSTGYILIGTTDGDKDATDDTAVSLPCFYPEANFVKASKKWGEIGYTPLTDIINFRKNNKLAGGVLYMRSEVCDLFRESDEVRVRYADFMRIPRVAGQELPEPFEDDFIEMMNKKYKLKIVLQDRLVNIPIGKGAYESVKPFADNTIVFLKNDDNLGRVVWTETAEAEQGGVDGVLYSTYDEYITVAKYSKNEPSYVEITKAEACAIPVIDNGHDTYIMQVDKVEAAPTPTKAKTKIGTETESQSPAVEQGFVVTEANFDESKAALQTIGVSIAHNISNPDTLNAKVTELDEVQFSAFAEAFNAQIG